ncbi:MAG: hypothetical protein ACYS1E_16330, partial [Planctomycetota bacterium]
LLLAVVGLVLAATGRINIWAAPLLYALGFVVVIFNSMRLVRFGEEFTEQEQARLRHEASRPVKPARHAATA